MLDRIAIATLTLVISSTTYAAIFIPVGTLTGDSTSEAVDASDDGAVVVGTNTWRDPVEGSIRETAFRWTSADGITGLSELPQTIRSRAYGVSGDGLVIAGEAVVSVRQSPYPYAYSTAYRWTDSDGMSELGFLNENYPFSTGAHGISADGSVIVGSSPGGAYIEAFLWTGDGMVGLGDLPPTDGIGNTVAEGVSADGLVVVGWGNEGTDNTTEAFRWTSGVMSRLGFLQGSPGPRVGASNGSSATGVSTDGSVLVGWSTSANSAPLPSPCTSPHSGCVGVEAFRWSEGVMTGLGDLQGGGFNSFATAVSGDGLTVIGDSESEFGPEAFVWTSDLGMQRLFDLLVASGAENLEGWKLVHASAISADGLWIAGTAVNAQGHREGFLANISPVPIPAATWLFGSALGVMGWLRRKVSK